MVWLLAPIWAYYSAFWGEGHLWFIFTEACQGSIQWPIIPHYKWPMEVAHIKTPDLLTLKQAIPNTMVPNPTCSEQILWAPSTTGNFSTKSAWLSLRTRRPSVEWYKLIWFPKAIPKCGSILWLAIRGRLGMQDRLHIDPSNLTCLLCNRQLETHDHLFFNCSYAWQI